MLLKFNLIRTISLKLAQTLSFFLELLSFFLSFEFFGPWVFFKMSKKRGWLSGSIFWKTFFKNSKQHFVLCEIEDESCNDLSIPCLTRHLTLSAWPFKKTEHLTTPLTPSKQMKKLIYHTSLRTFLCPRNDVLGCLESSWSCCS